jgi:hypothetical protein
MDRGDGQVVGGQLNPDWVEWLMGWPVGWTSLEPLSAERFRAWRAMSSTGLTASKDAETAKSRSASYVRGSRSRRG